MFGKTIAAFLFSLYLGSYIGKAICAGSRITMKDTHTHTHTHTEFDGSNCISSLISILVFELWRY